MKFCVRMMKNISWCAGFEILMPGVLRIDVGKRTLMGNIKLIIGHFENQPIRTAWDEEQEEWYFSVVDVVGVLTEQKSYDGARDYWKVMKSRLKKEGSQLVTVCNQLSFWLKNSHLQDYPGTIHRIIL